MQTRESIESNCN